jgi:hypothetical protein
LCNDGDAGVDTVRLLLAIPGLLFCTLLLLILDPGPGGFDGVDRLDNDDDDETDEDDGVDAARGRITCASTDELRDFLILEFGIVSDVCLKTRSISDVRGSLLKMINCNWPLLHFPRTVKPR